MMRQVIAAGVVIGLCGAVAAIAMSVGTQMARLRADTEEALQSVVEALEALRAADQSEALRNEVQQLRMLLEQQGQAPQGPAPGAAPEAVALPGRERAALGAVGAPLVLVEFVDYQCPFCKRFYDQTFERLKAEYVDTGRLRYVSRDLPLPYHPQAQQAAQAARCAGAQQQFWGMRQMLFTYQDDLSPEAIRDHAKALTLDLGEFDECVAGGRYLEVIEQDVEDARAAGITGTPTFVLGREGPDGIRGVKIVGAQPYAVFRARLEEHLAGE